MLFLTRFIIYLGHEIKWKNALAFIAAKRNAYSIGITDVMTKPQYICMCHPLFLNFYQFHLVWILLLIFPLEIIIFFKDNMIFTSYISWNESDSYLQCSYSWMWFLFAFILHIFSFCSSHQRFGGCLENIKGLSFTYSQANTGTSFLTLSILHIWNNSLTSWSKKLVFKSPPFTDELSSQNTVLLPADKLLTLPPMQLNYTYFWQGWKVSNS